MILNRPSHVCSVAWCVLYHCEVKRKRKEGSSFLAKKGNQDTTLQGKDAEKLG